jgi:L-lactate utilization protein LutB
LSHRQEGPIHFIEPFLESKRNAVIKQRFRKDKDFISLSPAQFQDKLKLLRKESVKNLDTNLKVLKKYSAEKKLFSLHIVKSTTDVVDYIATQNQKFNRQLNTVAINHSNTIRTIEPELVKSGFKVYHSYDNMLSSGTLGGFADVSKTESGVPHDMSSGNYWTLCNLEPENNFSSFNMTAEPRSYSRPIFSPVKPSEDFIGVIGANVFSSTGKILEVQHLYNISSIITHAKLTIIVLTVDKLVESFVDALFQARCTAMYGVEQIILEMFDSERGRNRGKDRISVSSKSINEPLNTKLEKYQPPKNLHVIVLDDSRADYKNTENEELLYCIGCRRCGLYCPRIRARLDDPNADTNVLTAHELVMDGYLYGLKTVIDEGLFDCTLCGSCSNLCPVGIDLAKHLAELRDRCQISDLFSEPHKRIRKNILETGNAYGTEQSMKAKQDTTSKTKVKTKTKTDSRRQR